MKLAFLIASLFAVVLARDSGKNGGDRTITRIVKLLQGMLDKSKADGDEERILYGKYKCYCDTNEAEKKASIESLKAQIASLGNDIDGLQAATGILSSEVAQLKADMAANVQARKEATAVRDKAKAAFLAFKADSEQAIEQMIEAIKTLSDIGADQTMANAAADHEQFMKGNSLVKLHSVVKKALLAAASTVKAKQAHVVESFLQAPFTGTYTAQSGEVVGILKDMRDTFESNLATAQATEKAEQEAYDKLMETLIEEYETMSDSYDEKQDKLGANDAELATKKSQLEEAEAQLAADEEFLANLLEMCAAKTKDYDERTLLRRNEEAAIAEAIAILNSDAAFETFGTVDATKSGATSFLQRRTIKEHVPRRTGGLGKPTIEGTKQQVESLLAKAAHGRPSLALSRIFTALLAYSPSAPSHAFETVLAEIKKMLGLIAEEEKVDQEQLEWCNTERETNNKALDTKNAQIISLNGVIADLTNLIENPETGLKFQISETELALEQNRKDQADTTADRKEANTAYQKDISNLVEAENLVEKAVAVLTKYYSKILKTEEGASFAQTRRQTPPATWENGSYKGQSAGGGDAISMLEFILSETKKEEAVAHKDEADSQKQFEDTMTDLTTQEKEMEDNLASLRELLAEKEQELLENKESLKKTEAEVAAIEAYLLKIKPGCDFITSNIAERSSNREQETDALNKATDLLKGTPAYQTAMAEAHNETLGGCLEKCAGNEEHVVCKACLAKVTEPAYCAGHPGTDGC